MRLTQPVSFKTREYDLLGRLYASQNPEQAKELLNTYDIPPIDQDHSCIPFYFHTFCNLQNIDPNEYRGRLYKSKKVEVRRLFTACMVRIYAPHLYVVPSAFNKKVTYGFITAIANTLFQPKQNVARMVKEVVTVEKVYTEFKEAVDVVVAQLTKKEGQDASA